MKRVVSKMDPSALLTQLKTESLVTSTTIQNVMKMAKRPLEHLNTDIWDDVANILWNHLNTPLNNFEDQLLCSTCLYSVLIHCKTQNIHLLLIRKLINDELEVKKIEKESKKTLVAVSLMYGLFQSSFLTNGEFQSINNVGALLEVMYNLLLDMAYEYTQYTFVVFKTISSFHKLGKTVFKQDFLNVAAQKKLLNMINHNWENPITGVRDLCKDIYLVILSIMDEELTKAVVDQVKSFYWNKAKFFMLAGIVKHLMKDGDVCFVDEMNLHEGLHLSLHKPGLVSAGADLYFEILKKVKTTENWYEIFLKSSVILLVGNSKKAVENFNNYWYLTTLKKFPEISQRLIQELEIQNELKYDDKLFSILYLMRQSNKLGLLEKNYEKIPLKSEKYIFEGLIHWDTAIRILAFEILCISNRKLVLSNTECELVLDYLQSNVNSDCTVLRQSMLSNVTCFLARLNQFYMKNNGTSDIDMVINFCKKLQDFMITSLDFKGNYQRKTTTLKIFDIVLTSFDEKPKDKDKKQKSKDTLALFLKNKYFWFLNTDEVLQTMMMHLKDPAEDIQQLVGHILLLHYSDNIIQPKRFNQLIKDTMENINSKFFFDVNCSMNIIKMIANILLDNNVPGNIKNVEELFSFGLENLKKSYEMRKKPVDAIFKGKQMHPYMSLILVVLQICKRKKYKLYVSAADMDDILLILKNTSTQFACEDTTSTSTDFAQMNDLVENFISKSCYSGSNYNFDTQITGLHKLVLNSLWLNVKASCELASFLILYCEDNVDVCKKCLKVITDVLETSRHKGAIEAAGTALGQAVQHLTSKSGNSDISMLPHELLTSKLGEWISEANKMASVTRRGAGMSIMVHRIVSSDMQKCKPLFHYFMKKLLEVCSCATNTLPTLKTDVKKSEKDVPKAIYIHFLTKIVIDSSLASHTLFYSTELAEIAFNNLTDEHWQIRNAALQLYGALVPKLIGQKKASGSDEESIATVAVDEFRTHFPKLWKYITEQLTTHKESSLQADSNLVPILNLLASLATKYSLNFEDDVNTELFLGLVTVLQSPIFVVRRLTAQCIYKIYSYENVYELLMGHQFSSENQLHGMLLLMKNYKNDICSNREHFEHLYKKYGIILKCGRHSYLCRELYENIFKVTDYVLKETFMEMFRNPHLPGVYSWMNSRLQSVILRSTWDEVPDLIRMIFLLNDHEIHLGQLAEMLSTQNDVTEEILFKIVETLLNYKQKYDSFNFWKILYNISLKVDIGEKIDFKAIMQSVKCIYHKNRYLLPLMARSEKFIEATQVNTIANCILMISCKQTDEDLKYAAALANNELASFIDNLEERMKLVIIINAIKFLQDENEDIRNISVFFVKNSEKDNFPLNPFICLQKMLNKNFLEKHLSDYQAAINSLKQSFAPQPYIPDDENDILEEFVDENNPFVSVSDNIYFEPNVVKELIYSLEQ